MREFCVENIMAWQAISDLQRQRDYLTEAEFEECAVNVYHTFLRSNAEFQVLIVTDV